VSKPKTPDDRKEGECTARHPAKRSSLINVSATFGTNSYTDQISYTDLDHRTAV